MYDSQSCTLYCIMEYRFFLGSATSLSWNRSLPELTFRYRHSTLGSPKKEKEIERREEMRERELMLGKGLSFVSRGERYTWAKLQRYGKSVPSGGATQ